MYRVFWLVTILKSKGARVAPPMVTADTPHTAVPNPWRTIWLHPRITIRQVLAAEVKPNWLPAVILGCLGLALGQVQTQLWDPRYDDYSNRWAGLQTLKVWAYNFGVSPYVLAYLGRLMGATVDASQVRPVIMWSCVPAAVVGALWIPLLYAYGSRLFTENLTEELPLLLLDLVTAIAALWVSVIYLAMIAEVQRCSVGRAFGLFLLNILTCIVFVRLLGFIN